MVEFTVRVYRDYKKQVKKEIKMKEYDYTSKGKMPFNRLLADLLKED